MKTGEDRETGLSQTPDFYTDRAILSTHFCPGRLNRLAAESRAAATGAGTPRSNVAPLGRMRTAAHWWTSPRPTIAAWQEMSWSAIHARPWLPSWPMDSADEPADPFI